MTPVRISLEGIKAVIFDMDGTMIDNMSYHLQAWQQFLQRYGIILTEAEFQQKISGQKNDKIVELVFGRPPTSDEVKQYGDEKEALYRELYRPHIVSIDGLNGCIDNLRGRGLKTAVATTACFENRELVLDALDIRDKFEVILGDEHVTHGKPAPDIYLATAERLGVRPEECMVFEDSPPGVQAARAAGMRVVGILSSHSAAELNGAEWTVRTYNELQFA